MKQLQVKKHMMTAISYLIPFVCAAGMLMVIGNIAGGTSVTDFSKQLAIPDLLTTLGGQALGFLPVVISTGIAYSIADKAGIAPGVIMGILCKADGYGFLGGLISGFLVGYLTAWLIKVIKVPQWIAGLLPQLILPLLGSVGYAVCNRGTNCYAYKCNHRIISKYAVRKWIFDHIWTCYRNFISC